MRTVDVGVVPLQQPAHTWAGWRGPAVLGVRERLAVEERKEDGGLQEASCPGRRGPRDRRHGQLEYRC